MRLPLLESALQCPVLAEPDIVRNPLVIIDRHPRLPDVYTPFPVEPRACGAAAVALQRAVLAGRVRPRKDPVLPGRKPAENLGRDGLGAGKAQIRFHPGQRIGREAGALFDGEADLVLPVELVGRKGHETEIERRRSIERRSRRTSRSPTIAVEAGRQPAAAIDHLEAAEVERAQRDLRPVRQHVAAVGGEGELEQAAGKARAFVDHRKEAARGHIEPLQGAAQEADRLAHEPVLPMRGHRRCRRPARRRCRRASSGALCRSRDDWRAASGSRRPIRAPSPAATSGRLARRCSARSAGHLASGPFTVKVATRSFGRDVDLHPAVSVAALVDAAFERRQRNSRRHRPGGRFVRASARARSSTSCRNRAGGAM